MKILQIHPMMPLLLDEEHKYLVGIKSFGINSGDQKSHNLKRIVNLIIGEVS